MNNAVLGFRLGRAVLPVLPSWLEEYLAVAFGWIAWLINRHGRQAVSANLRIVLGREPSRSEVRATFVTAAQNYCDLFYFPRFSVEQIDRQVEVLGWEHLVATLRGRHGAILASLHLGNIEVVAGIAVRRGLEIVVPVERIEPPELLNLMVRSRQASGLRCVPVGKDAAAEIRAALQRNALVGIGADRITLGDGEKITFCGRPARLPIAAALLARRYGAPILPIGVRRLPHHHFRVEIAPALPPVRSGSLRDDLRAQTQALFDHLVVMLRSNPTQWTVFRPVWEA